MLYPEARPAKRKRALVETCDTRSGRWLLGPMIGTQPGVLPPVPYQDVRLGQPDRAKLLGQRALARKGGGQTARRGRDC